MRILLCLVAAAIVGAPAFIGFGTPASGEGRSPHAGFALNAARTLDGWGEGGEPGGPPPSPQTVQCGETATGRLESEDPSGLTIKVISSCKLGKRVPGLPGLGRLNSRCDIVRTKVRFDSRPDGSRSYTKEAVKFKNCCDEVVKNVVRVKQLCR